MGKLYGRNRDALRKGGSEMENKIDPKDDALTRRDFIKKTAGTALATTALTMGQVTNPEAAEGEKASIRLSKEFTTSLSVSSLKVDFPMMGADVFARACVEEGLSALFACPGKVLPSSIPWPIRGSAFSQVDMRATWPMRLMDSSE